MPPQPRSCALLHLPAELRTQIYELLLIITLEQPHHKALPHSSTTPTPSSSRFCANILQTCTQIHSEATPILYGSNTFLAHPSLLAALPALLLAVRPHKLALPPVLHPRVAALIRRFHILVRLDTDPRFTRAQASESFSGAEELEVEVFQAMYGSCDFAVLALFEGVRGVGRAVVGGSCGDGRYAAWLEGSMMSALGTEVRPFEGANNTGWEAWTEGNR